MKRGRMRFFYRLAGLSVTVLAKVLFGLRVIDADKVPREGKLILVANHVSNFDPPIIGGVIPREVTFAAKQELFKGLLGKVIKYLNSVPIRRTGSDKEAIKAIRDRLIRGEAVLIFPEGTRTRSVEERNMKYGAGLLAMLSGSDLQPIRIDGTSDLRKAFFRNPPITVRFGDIVRLEPLVADKPPKKEAYARIAEALMKEVDRLDQAG